MQEDDLLATLPAIFAGDDPGVVTGSGPDDCAHVLADGRRLAFSVDAFAEGSHFLPDADPGDVAGKALGASLSDLAASACRARWALVSLCLRRGAGAGWADRFARGLAAAARRFGVTVVGGDTISSPHGTFVSVTVAGEPLPGGPLLRGGGRAGDILAVTGRLGGSIRGRHLRPEPRLREMERLMRFCGRLEPELAFPSAAMDISDGLALDLGRLCRESGVGAVVDADAVPISPDATALAGESGLDPLRHALSDGEDFELLVAFPPPVWEAFAQYDAAAEAGLARFTRIGVLTDGGGLRLRTRGGLEPLAPEGYQHRW